MVKIKDIPRVDRPREKLLKYGPAKLSTTELLAILLRTGIKGKNVIELSGQILQAIGTNKIKNISLDHLQTIKGLGKVKALEIIAAIELGKRLLVDEEKVHVANPADIYESLKDIRSHKKEHFIAFYLDTKHEEITRELISIGSLNETIVHPREVFEPAIRCLACSVIVAHNHPSGDPEPSKEDVSLTHQLRDAGKILGITLLDHVIIYKNGYTSMKDKGLLEQTLNS